MKQSLKQQLMKLKQNKQTNPEKPPLDPKASSNSDNKQIKFKKNAQKDQDVSKQAKNLFRGITFCMPYFDIQLTEKQAQYTAKLILSQGGKVLDQWKHLHHQPIEYVLISSKVRPQTVQKKIESHLNYIDILDYNYITCCITQGETIDPAKFSLLHSKDENEEKKQRKDSPSNSGKKKQKVQEEQPDDQNEQKRSITEELPPSDEEEIDPQQRNYTKLDKNKFFCQKGKDQDKPSMNKFIQEELLSLQKIYANERDIGRKIAYGKAASIIKTWKQEIKTQQDVDKIPGIGPKINQKIKQIVSTGKLRKLDEFNKSESVIAMGELSKVWGIGPAKAKELYQQGVKSISQLRKNQSSLTRNQKIGLKYFQDFQKRIPRQKVQKMFEHVRKTLNSITKNSDAYKAEVCGSFRRGKATCGDMDIIITRKDGVFENDLLVKLVAQLQKNGFITDNLSEPKCNQGHVSTSYMGVCKFEDETHHRIDIKHYPLDEYAFALLYFTGSGMFNRSMRLYALKLGLQLSDKGFVKKPYKGVSWDKPIPVCYTEEDVFKVLGLDYKAPKDRDD